MIFGLGTKSHKVHKMNLKGRNVQAENGIEGATKTDTILILLVFLKLSGSETYLELS
jgi:hypothetical protein